MVVRSAFDVMKASEWEKEDAMSEGIPIINNRPPKEFLHDNGKLTGIVFECVRPIPDGKGRYRYEPSGEPDVVMECDHVLMAIGQENHCPWVERDVGIEFDKWDCPILDEDTLQSSHPKIFFGGDSALGPENIIWASAHAHKAAISIHLMCQGKDIKKDRPPEGVNLVSQKMGVHQWSYDAEHDDSKRFLVPHANKTQGARQHQDRGGTRLRCPVGPEGGPALSQLRRADRVHGEPVHRVRRLRGHLPDGLHHLHPQRRRARVARRR